MNENENNSETTSTENTESVVLEAVETTPEVEVTTPESKTEEVVEVAPEADVVTPDEKKEESVTVVVDEKTEEVATPVADEKKDAAEVASAAVVATTASLKNKMQKCGAWLRRFRYSILAVILVAVAILGLTYIMESEGRINTGLFDKVNVLADNYKAVATVNKTKITKHDLNVSVSQLSAAAAAQGADATDEKVIDDIKNQALDMLVNTELLKQEAAARNIAITDEDVAARLETLKTDVGGEEALKERMQQFGVDEKTLKRDIKNELTIQALLDQVFTEKGVTVSDEEIKAFYDQAVGTEKKADIPKLDAVRDQIEKQLRSTKEQEVVSAYIEELRKNAAIETLI